MERLSPGQLCPYYFSPMGCKHGASCWYAHSQDDNTVRTLDCVEEEIAFETAHEQHQLYPTNLRPKGKDRFSGFMFLCSNETVDECFDQQLFGLPANFLKQMNKVGKTALYYSTNISSPTWFFAVHA